MSAAETRPDAVTPAQTTPKGWVAWFVDNTVAANLLALSLVVGGLLTIPFLRTEVFPELEPNVVTVAVPYPGATPEETEEAICVRIEEAVAGITGVDKVTSSATEGAGAVTIEALNEADMDKLFNDVKTRVDGITTFPEEAEEPTVQRLTIRKQVINVAVHGDADERSLRNLGEDLRDRISDLPGITQVQLSSVRPFEVSIEISEQALRRYGMTFDQVADAVRRSSLDLPAGTIKTDAGNRLLRTKGQAYVGKDFEDLVLITNSDGSRVTLGEVARVIDGFADTDLVARFDGEPAVVVEVYRVGNQNALDITAAVREFVDGYRSSIPEGLSITTWRDESKILRGRIDLLLGNAAQGFLLVALVLTLFLKLRLAFWVVIGIPVTFLGAVAVMPLVGASINLISLFAFIVVLGIVVDDAIVVGENVFKKHKIPGIHPKRAALVGAKEVAVPVTFAVLTTVVAFTPMFNVPGTDGQIWAVIPSIVIAVLLFSLVESKLILPSHLTFVSTSDETPRFWIGRVWSRFQGFFSNGLETFVKRVYQPAFEVMLRWRYATLSAAFGVLLITVSLAGMGYIPFVFFPSVEGDNAVALLTMPQGTPAELTTEHMRRIERAAEEVRREIDGEVGMPDGESVALHWLTTVGSHPYAAEQAQNQGDRNSDQESGSHLGQINVQLMPSETRPDAASADEFTRRWRERVGTVPDAVKLEFTTSLFTTGKDIDIQLAHEDLDTLRVAAADLKQHLATYSGTIDIGDTFLAGKQEIELHMKPSAEVLGLTVQDLARQVRQAFYGEEAQRIQRGRDDIKVMVRYPEGSRRSIGDLDELRIRTPAGDEVPLAEVAVATFERGASTIKRSDRKRVIRVQAEVDDQVAGANADQIQSSLAGDYMPELVRRYNGLSWSFEGDAKKKGETLAGLMYGYFFALFLMYVLMAIPFKSYLQPLIIMSAIPFGLVGAIWGHFITGYELSIMSMFGLVALSGVVVNDSLVLVDFINRKRQDHSSLETAIREAGAHRFRPILLTSLTTFAGLTPLMFETSVQAQFLIPMAVSLAYGVMFSTVISLVIVPSLYMVLEDGKRGWAWLFGRQSTAPAPSTGSEPGAAQPA